MTHVFAVLDEEWEGYGFELEQIDPAMRRGPRREEPSNLSFRPST
jgi:hypothetical protein